MTNLTKRKKLLLVDDDAVFSGVLARALGKRGFDVRCATHSNEAKALVKQHHPGFAVVDLKLEHESGLDLIPVLKAVDEDMVIVVLTGYASITTAVEAVKRGAANYLAKPVKADEVVQALYAEKHQSALPNDYAPMSVERLEWEHIQKVLAEHDGNISATARSLGMHRRTLQRKLAKKPVRR